MNLARKSRCCFSSSTSASLQSGNRCCGDGLGAGVGGDAGAEGGSVVVIGMLGVRRPALPLAMNLRCWLAVLYGPVAWGGLVDEEA